MRSNLSALVLKSGLALTTALGLGTAAALAQTPAAEPASVTAAPPPPSAGTPEAVAPATPATPDPSAPVAKKEKPVRAYGYYGYSYGAKGITPSMHLDRSTGRSNLPLSRPWMKPLR